MVLKLLGSSRNTNDLDYVFIPYESKKEIKDFISDELSKEFFDVSFEMHSTCLKFYVTQSGFKLQIEINVDTFCKSIELTTFELLKKYGQKSGIIRAMSYDVSLSHKIAAWNERNLVRDLYDIYFFISVLGEKPDIEILKKRLSAVKIKNKKVQMDIKELIAKLNDISEKLNYDYIKNEMEDYLPADELPGLDKKIKIALFKLVEFLEKS